MGAAPGLTATPRAPMMVSKGRRSVCRGSGHRGGRCKASTITAKSRFCEKKRDPYAGKVPIASDAGCPILASEIYGMKRV